MNMLDLQFLEKAQSQSLVGKHAQIHEWGVTQLNQFLKKGFPNRKDEDWRYADLKNFCEQQFRPCSVNDSVEVNAAYPALADSWVFVFFNGQFSPHFSKLTGLPPEIILTNLATALCQYPQLIEKHLLGEEKNVNSFSLLNAALLGDGLFLSIPENTILKKPIQLLYISTEKQRMTLPRHLLLLGASSKATILEEYVGLRNNAYFNNVYTKIILESNANLEYYKFQQENLNAFHMANTAIYLQKGSSLQAFHLNKGAELSRDDIHIYLQGAEASCELVGFYYPQGEQYMDYHTAIFHENSYTLSKQFYKGILKDRGRGVFNGKIVAAANTRQVKAGQHNHNLLISKTAEINSKPELEVYAHDIQCNHGATVGNLDANALFYLQSRGVAIEEAKDMLISGFGNEIFKKMPNLPIAEYLYKQLFGTSYAKA